MTEATYTQAREIGVQSALKTATGGVKHHRDGCTCAIHAPSLHRAARLESLAAVKDKVIVHLMRGSAGIKRSAEYRAKLSAAGKRRAERERPAREAARAARKAERLAKW